MSTLQTFSGDDLLRIIGDDDLDTLAELQALLGIECGRILAEMTEAAGAADNTRMARAAHKLKSVAGNVGGHAVRQLAMSMEDAAKRSDDAEVTRLLADLGPALEALAQAFGDFVSVRRARSSDGGPAGPVQP